MSEREKEIINKFSNTIPKLDKENQSYLLGFVEGMALNKNESEKNDEKKN